MAVILEVHNLNISYGKKKIVDNFHLKVEKNQFVALTGRNGSGKSTILKSILGIIKFQGRIHLKTDKIGYLPQSYLLDRSFPITVFEFLQLAYVKEKKVSHEQQQNEITQILETLKISFLGKLFLNELSQGQFQKVLFARSLLNSPELLILDEPLSNIDESSAIELKNLLNDLNHKGTSILLTIHDSQFVKENCNAIYNLSSDQIDENGIIDFCLHPKEEN